MQTTTFGRTSAPVQVIAPVQSTDPTDPANPSNPTTPTDPTPPPVNPGTPTVPPVTPVTTTLPSQLANQPIVMDMLHPDTVSVFQAISYNQPRLEYYITQATNGSNGSADPYNSTVITRLDHNGKFIDQMKLIDAGHGTSMVMENYGTKNIVYIWLSFANQNNTYYRFPYKKGTFKFADIPSKTKIPKFRSNYSTYHLDWYADTLMERVSNSDNTMDLYKRKISEVLKNVNHVYATIHTLPTKTQQGWATINDSAYVLQGGLNGETASPQDLSYLDTYNWSTGTRVDHQNIMSLGTEPGGGWLKDTHEPEALSMYRDGVSHKASLLLGIATGIYIKNTSGHKWWLYRYTSIGTAP